jgi:hypothetical protein
VPDGGQSFDQNEDCCKMSAWHPGLMFAHSSSLLQWYGYTPWQTQIQLRNRRKEPITLPRLVQLVASGVDRFLRVGSPHSFDVIQSSELLISRSMGLSQIPLFLNGGSAIVPSSLQIVLCWLVLSRPLRVASCQSCGSQISGLIPTA